MRGSGFDRLSHGMCSRHEARHMPRLRLAPPRSNARFRVAVAELGCVRPMRNALRIIIVVSLLWIVLLSIAVSSRRRVLPDAVIPERLLLLASSEEFQHMSDRLVHTSRPNLIDWIPPVCILLVASFALFMSKRFGTKTLA